MKYLLSILCSLILLLSFLYPNSLYFNHNDYKNNQEKLRNSSDLIFTFGYSTPTNIYSSYSSQGSTFKLTVENPVFNHKYLKYNFGWQRISFAENIISYDDWSGLQVREGEAANLFDVGIKFIVNDGIFGNGFFRPYINASVGYGFFNQYTEYDYPDTFNPDTFENECDNFWSILFHIIFEDDCDTGTNYNINTTVDTRMSSSFKSIDLGTRFTFLKPSVAIEFGVRYNMIKSIQASDWSSWEDIQDQQSFDEIIGNKLNADYKTIYLGVSIYGQPR